MISPTEQLLAALVALVPKPSSAADWNDCCVALTLVWRDSSGANTFDALGLPLLSSSIVSALVSGDDDAMRRRGATFDDIEATGDTNA